MRQLKLDTPQQVRQSMTRVVNMLLNDQIAPKTANSIFYGCSTILSAIRIDEQQKRIDELERAISELEANRYG